MVVYNCENTLEIFGKWESLKKFYNDNWGETVLNIKDIQMIEWEREVYKEKMDSIYYTFLTRDVPPIDWLEEISKLYVDLDFTLGYMNRESGKGGEVVYRGGEIYYNGEEVL